MQSVDHYTTILTNNIHSRVKQTPEPWNITHTHTPAPQSVVTELRLRFMCESGAVT